MLSELARELPQLAQELAAVAHVQAICDDWAYTSGNLNTINLNSVLLKLWD